jgi:hypothetical protein
LKQLSLILKEVKIMIVYTFGKCHVLKNIRRLFKIAIGLSVDVIISAAHQGQIKNPVHFQTTSTTGCPRKPTPLLLQRRSINSALSG